jgi:hypothetical protein
MKPPYLKDPLYLKELVPINTIAALRQVEGDLETQELCYDVAEAMYRLRDKLAGRPVRPKETFDPSRMDPLCYHFNPGTNTYQKMDKDLD